MNSEVHLPHLYRDLAEWWPVLSAPEDYAEEAEFFRRVIVGAAGTPPKTVLELGSGGGNNASHLKQHFGMTLVDLSSGMLAVSQRLNPECEHIQGDMRTVRLGRQFDAVFIHDAIEYMTTEADLRAAIATAWIHCRPGGGAAVFCPDFVREGFQPSTDHGGHDVGDRHLRYLQWTWDPDPGDTSYSSDMVYIMREGNGEPEVVLDRHTWGLFGREDWLRWITEAGFQADAVPFEHSEVPAGSTYVFVGKKNTEG
ncbi:MAG: class I SAM-dependent methyltransferase [Anaerolineae bacterium]